MNYKIISAVLLCLFIVCSMPRHAIGRLKSFFHKKWSGILTMLFEAKAIFDRDDFFLKPQKKISFKERVKAFCEDLKTLWLRFLSLTKEGLHFLRNTASRFCPTFSLTKDGKLLLPKTLFAIGLLFVVLSNWIEKSGSLILHCLLVVMVSYAFMYLIFHTMLLLLDLFGKISKVFAILAFFLFYFPLLVLVSSETFFLRRLSPSIALCEVLMMIGPLLAALLVWTLGGMGGKTSSKISLGGIQFLIAPFAFALGLYVLLSGVGTALYIADHPKVNIAQNVSGKVLSEDAYKKATPNTFDPVGNVNSLIRVAKLTVPYVNHVFLYGTQRLLSMDDPSVTDQQLKKSQKNEIRAVLVEGYLSLALYTGVIIVFVTNTFSDFKIEPTGFEKALEFFPEDKRK